MSVDHFNQNGNIKNISHIDAEVVIENEDSSIQKQTNDESLNAKIEIELAVKDGQLEKKVKGEFDKADDAPEVKHESLFKYPTQKSFCHQIMWIIIWPVQLLFWLTIPNCETKRFKNLFPLTFLMCIVWIGSLSYLVAWMITIVGKFARKNKKKTEKTSTFLSFNQTGDTLNIPDSVMGITFLAAGTSVPEAVSSVIVAKQGKIDMSRKILKLRNK